MLSLAFKFPTGRFHATAWGHHVNEGVVEWPPSAWRIARALLAVWYRMGNPGGEETIRRLIYMMTGPPSYEAPDCKHGHTRHFMPKYKSTIDRKTDKIFDVFIVVPKNSQLIVSWPDAHPDTDVLSLLDYLLDRMNYLGRGESWVQGSVVKLAPDWSPNVRVVESNDVTSDALMRRLVLMTPEEYDQWLNERRNTIPEKSWKKEKKKYPDNLFEALQIGTSELNKNGWNRPPGSKWITYENITGSEKRPDFIAMSSPLNLPDTARFSIVSAVKPRIGNALKLCERLRMGLMAHSRTGDDIGDVSTVFSGKTPDGQPLQEQHKHAFFIAEDADGDGFIDHFTVFAGKGFDAPAIKAVGSLRKLWGEGGHDLYLALTAMGRRNEILKDYQVQRNWPVIGSSRVWISMTPYFPTRYPKRKRSGEPKYNTEGLWIDGPEDQIRKELKYRSIPEPISVVCKRGIWRNGHRYVPAEFVSHRKSGKQRPNIPGLFVKLIFENPVPGPIALGYACHFGLGVFIPAEDDENGHKTT